MCDRSCIYFPDEAEVLDEYIEDNVKNRRVRRICGYSHKPIKNWRDCHRRGGPNYGKGK